MLADLASSRRLRVAFVMPCTCKFPVGGAKTVYQYADFLAWRGHEVTLVHPRASLLDESRGVDESGAESFAADPHPWYQSRPEVRNVMVADISEETIGGEYDAIVVNNQRSLAWAAKYSPRMGERIYFMQDYESYVLGGDADREQALRALLLLDWPVLCTSRVVERLVHATANRTCVLLNKAIDTELFFISTPIDSRERRAIGFPARLERSKRTEDAIRALEIVRTKAPSDIEFWSFGYDRPAELPDWILHHLAPSGAELAELYNRTRIFVVASENEGNGLPGAEAMACGAALVSRRNGGVETYAVHEHSALLCPVRDPAALARSVLRLLADDALWRHIARNGAEEMSKQTIAGCAAEFEGAIVAVVLGSTNASRPGV
jgi:glycosyltransferase involved in cell wall biosynthesis